MKRASWQHQEEEESHKRSKTTPPPSNNELQLAVRTHLLPHLLPEITTIVLGYYGRLIEGRVVRTIPITITPYQLMSLGNDFLLFGRAQQDLTVEGLDNQFRVLSKHRPTAEEHTTSLCDRLTTGRAALMTSNSHGIYYIADATRQLHLVGTDAKLTNTHQGQRFTGHWCLAADDMEVVSFRGATGQLLVMDAQTLEQKRERQIITYQKPHLALTTDEIFIAGVQTAIYVYDRNTLQCLRYWNGHSAGLYHDLEPGQLVVLGAEVFVIDHYLSCSEIQVFSLAGEFLHTITVAPEDARHDFVLESLCTDGQRLYAGVVGDKRVITIL